MMADDCSRGCDYIGVGGTLICCLHTDVVHSTHSVIDELLVVFEAKFGLAGNLLFHS